MSKKITLIVLAFFASIFLVACGKSPDVTANAKGTKIGDTIKIGVNMELTGAVAAYGRQSRMVLSWLLMKLIKQVASMARNLSLSQKIINLKTLKLQHPQQTWLFRVM